MRSGRRRAIIVFDCETTGIDFTQDQVIELCVQHGLDDSATSRVWRIKPSVPINPAAQAVHGISMADLEGCASFAAYADEIAEVFANADVIVGYNLSFDIDMLQAEYTRIGKPMLDLTGKKIVDAFRLWQQCEPRSLQHAHRRFVGDDFAAAHSASADVAATGRVLVGMLEHFKLADQDWGQIAQRVRSAARELGRPVAPPALGRRGDRARLRQAHGHAAARARERPRPQLPALGDRARTSRRTSSRSAARRSSAAARSSSRGRASATASRRRQRSRRSRSSAAARGRYASVTVIVVPAASRRRS